MYQRIKEIPYYEIIKRTNHLYIVNNKKFLIIDMGYKIVNGLQYYVIDMISTEPNYDRRRWMYEKVITLYFKNTESIQLIYQNIVLR